jgi:hypothetical protein
LPYYFRKISKTKWYTAADGVKHSWVPADERQGDCLSDLRTTENALSFWHVDDGLLNLNDVILANAGASTSLQHVDYVLFEAEDVDAICEAMVHSEGISPHTRANQKWHRDATRLTAGQVYRLTRDAGIHSICRVQRKAVRSLLEDAVEKGVLEAEKMDSGLRSDLRLDSPTDGGASMGDSR